MTDLPAPDGSTPDHDDVVDALVQTSFTTMGVLTRVAAEHDLSLTQLRVLAILRDRRPRMAVLAQFLGLDRSTMTGLVGRAEARGLLQRAANPDDGRAVDVFLTADGADLAGRVRDEAAQALAPLTAQLTPGEQARLRALLERMLDRAGPTTASRRSGWLG